MLAQRNKVIDIVLLEENLQLRNNISSRFRTQGLSVDAPSGGFHSIKVLEENQVNAIILCSDMDDMSWHEVATIVRSMPSPQGQVAIFLYTSEAISAESIKIIKELRVNGIFAAKDFSKLADAVQNLSKI